MAVQKEKDAALHRAYVPVHIHRASFTECSTPCSPSKLQASSGYWLLLYMFAYIYVIRLLQAS